MDAENSPAEGTGIHSRACENCHKRKIRCDRLSPCSNCRSSKLTCRALQRKTGEQRQRIHVSSQYEQKINNIEEQLSSIHQILKTLTKNTTNIAQTETVVGPSTTFASLDDTSDGSPLNESTASDSPAFEGDSSLSAQSKFASRLLEEAVGQSPSGGLASEITNALSSLEIIVNRYDRQSAFHEVQFPLQKPRERPSNNNVELPLMSDIIDILRWAKGPSFPALPCFLPLITINSLTELCKKVYFCTDEYSPAEFIIMNSCLHFLLQEYCSTYNEDPATEKFRKHDMLCRTNMETGLGNLDLFLAPTLDNAKALVLGCLHTLDASLPTLGWTLTSNAARICQTLGFHRSTSLKNDTPEERETKKAVFWCVYIMDKTLSLRLGRASTIQEYDISLDMLEMSVDPKIQPWDVIWALWVEAASIHGWIYEQLYSPKGLNQSDEERMATVRRLSAYTNAAQRKNAEVQANSAKAFRPEYIKFVLDADEVVYWSLLTLIYRAAPKDPQDSLPFNKDCLNAARSALMSHQGCASRYRNDTNEYMWTIYLHWTLLSCPFIPFLVVFCHAVTFLDEDDMARLEQFVASLLPTKRSSEAGIKMYRLCSMFHRVGKLYMDGRLRDRQDQLITTQTWDPYMNALKIVPGLSQLDEWNTSSMDMTANGMNGLELQNNPTALGDWFEGNQFIFGLLESDLSGLDFPATSNAM